MVDILTSIKDLNLFAIWITLIRFLSITDKAWQSNNTPARIDRSELYLDIAVEPVKAVEFIYIPLRLKNTGEIAGL